MENNKKGNFFEVISEGKRKYEKKIEMEFENKKKKALEEADEIFFYLKDWEKTAEFFESKEHYLNAAFIYKKAKNLKKSKDNFWKVAQIFEQKGIYPKAAYNIYERLGDIEKAAMILENWYFYNKETSYYSKDITNLEDYLFKAVELNLRINRINKAHQLLLKNGKYKMAADILRT